ncbi:MAG: DUF1972 domain-containing protein [Flavisolibacter sp.]
MKPHLKIGILGCRGIPNAYGGFEQFAEYLSVALVERGHQVSVYNSHHHPYQQKEWKGVQIIHCFDWEKRLGTAGQFIYDYNCFSDARKRDFDILFQLGYTSNSIWYKRWPAKMINIVNMDGLEWKRSKYNQATKMFLKYAEGLAARHSDYMIADSRGIQEYLDLKYKRISTYIPYGSHIIEPGDTTFLNTYKLRPHEYYLLIARMEPENNIEMIIQGYLWSAKKFPLVIVGNAANDFGKYLRKKYEDKSLIFTGAIFHVPTINCLRSYSSIYFHGHSVGGTNPSLLEAMGCYCNIAAHENVFNSAILEDCADYFSSASDIKNIINKEPGIDMLNDRKEKNAEKIRTVYNWNRIVDEYENLFFHSIELKKQTS